MTKQKKPKYIYAAIQEPRYTSDNAFSRMMTELIRKRAYGGVSPARPPAMLDVLLEGNRHLFETRGNLILYRAELAAKHAQRASDERMRKAGISIG